MTSPTTDWSEIAAWVLKSDQVFIKKLSRNDCSWADDPEKHQAGFYVPAQIRESGFFPALSNDETSKDHIFDNHFSMVWPQLSQLMRVRNVHYSNKGPESHLTLVPEELFRGLSPASLVLIGRLAQPIQFDDPSFDLRSTRLRRKLLPPTDPASYWCIVVDSLSDDAEIVESQFALTADFHFDLYSPEAITAKLSDEDRLIEEIDSALRNGTLHEFIAKQSMPSPRQFAKAAQDQWLLEAGVRMLDPYAIEHPGDAVMRISRDIEFSLFKAAELRLRAAQAAGVLLQGNPVATLVRGHRELDRIFLSTAQSRKSRAGLSFEYHIQRMLHDGRISHEAQVIFGSRRPDFVLPHVAALADPDNRERLILSAKTTLRERWKQLGLERIDSQVFLATVDDRVSASAIADMHKAGIVMVVPESLKGSKEAHYEGQTNVITFSEFFHAELAARPTVLIPGPPPPATRPALP